MIIKYKLLNLKFILLFVFLLTISNLILFIALLQGFSLDIITFINTSLKLKGGMKILDDFFAPEGFIAPLIYYYLGIYIENKIVSHFAISIFFNSIYFFLIFKIINYKYKNIKISLLFAFISSCFFLSLMGGIYFDHFILIFFLIGILSAHLNQSYFFKVVILSIIFNLMFFSKISLALPSAFLILIYNYFHINSKKYEFILYITICSILFFLIIILFIITRDWSEYLKQVFEVGYVYSKYFKNSNIIEVLISPFDFNHNLLILNMHKLFSGNYNLNYGFLLSSIYSITIISIVIILIANKQKNYFLFFLIFAQYLLFSTSGQGFAIKYFLTGLISASLYFAMYNFFLKLLKIITINAIFILLLLNNVFLNKEDINNISNFKLYDKNIFYENIDRYQPNLDLDKYFDIIIKKIENNKYFVLNKQLFYINLFTNRHSVDPLTMYDHVNCNKFQTLCTDLVINKIDLQKPKFLIFVAKSGKWNMDGYLYDINSELLKKYKTKKTIYGQIYLLEIIYE